LLIEVYASETFAPVHPVRDFAAPLMDPITPFGHFGARDNIRANPSEREHDDESAAPDAAVYGAEI
jgi:hypothetical protein